MTPLDPHKLPVHLAVIMDGNGRWAQQRMLKRIVGHQRGAETVKMVVEQASLLGIKYLTLFAFSSENWSRPVLEVRALMTLLKKYIRQETARMMRKNIRYNVIGNRSDLPDDVNETLNEAIHKTAANTGMVLTLALSYACAVNRAPIRPNTIITMMRLCLVSQPRSSLRCSRAQTGRTR